MSETIKLVAFSQWRRYFLLVCVRIFEVCHHWYAMADADSRLYNCAYDRHMIITCARLASGTKSHPLDLCEPAAELVLFAEPEDYG